MNFKKLSNLAGEISDNYMLLSLILSMVLFFSGMSGITDSILSQRILLGVALTVFAVVVIFILKMPIHT